MWKKIQQLLGVHHHNKGDDSDEFELVHFKKKDPIDVQFTKNFVASGAFFFYSENEQEILKNLKDIVDNENINEILCFDNDLKSLLNRLNVKHTEDFDTFSNYAFIKCEYLMAFDGSIMMSSHQTKGRKQDEMPENLIVYATPSQFVSNISDALQKLKSVKKDDIPTNITSIRGKNVNNMPVSSFSKNIFLLLAESYQ